MHALQAGLLQNCGVWLLGPDSWDRRNLTWKSCASLNAVPKKLSKAWRKLDEDLSGFITLGEIDRESHDLLTSFKDWADGSFGSVAMAFKFLDKDGSGELTFSEFRKACKKYRWKGDSGGHKYGLLASTA